MSFTIPTKPAEADALAGELGELATATEWKRAAIVYARVKVGDHGGDRSKINNDLAQGKITPNEYALRQIHGLRSATTIRAYWRAWDNAVTEGIAQPVNLGDEVELPDAEWGDYYQPLTVPKEPYAVPPPVDDHILDRETRWGGVIDSDELGQCPPMASDLEAGENDEYTAAMNALRENAQHERERLEEDDDFDEEEWRNQVRARKITALDRDCRYLVAAAIRIVEDGPYTTASMKLLKNVLKQLDNVHTLIGSVVAEGDQA